jgi:hypothetical protein
VPVWVPQLRARWTAIKRVVAGAIRHPDTAGAGDAWREALAILTDLRHPDAEDVRARFADLESNRAR